MKSNPKKCSFMVVEGKFLGYMVTSEGIRANPKKTKAIADMQSPRTLREMYRLSGKLVALKRFLSRSAERSLPLFESLKDITKENKDEYRWTESAEKAFQEMKKVIVELPLLTTPAKEETLYVYLAAAAEAVSAILNKAQASRKLAKYSEELGTYNITYEPRNAIKDQVLADFLLEAPVGTHPEEFFRLPARVQSKDEAEKLRMATKMKVHDIDVKVDSKAGCKSDQRKPTTSLEKYTWDPAECTSEQVPSTRFGAKTPKNHRPMAILSMGNGHPWSTTPIRRKVEVHHYSHRLLHKVDRSQAFGQDHWEGCEEVRMG
ncbi:reverse transcriptase domain-containing protein [Tanacetum coccineum]